MNSLPAVIRHLPPGAALSRAALTAQFGVSAAPVRDATRLEDEGLVEVFSKMFPHDIRSD